MPRRHQPAMTILDEVMSTSDELVRLRSTFALFGMRAVLRSEGSSREHALRLRLVDDELRARGALS